MVEWRSGLAREAVRSGQLDSDDVDGTADSVRDASDTAAGDTHSRVPDAPTGGSSRRSRSRSEPTTETVSGAATVSGLDQRERDLFRGSGPTLDETETVRVETDGDRTISQRARSVGSDIRGRVGEGVGRATDGVDSVSDRLPGRAGQAFAAGAGIAAIPEPTPATEITGATIAGGAALVGGGIIASRAVRDSELEPGDAVRDELIPGQAQRDVQEIDVTEDDVPSRELTVSEEVLSGSELGIGSATTSSELDVSGGTGTGTGTQTPDDTVVPGDYPIPGRDIPRNPNEDAPSEPSPEDVVGGPDTATGVTIGSGTGSGTTGGQREVGTGTGVGTGAGTASEILDEVRRDIEDPVDRDPRGAFERVREFPTGESAVVGREVGRLEDATTSGLGTQIGSGFGFGFGPGQPPQDPLGGGIGQQDQSGMLGEVDLISGLGEQTGPEVGPRTEPETGVGPGTGTDTATETAIRQALGVRADTALEPAPAFDQQLAQETVTDTAFAEPTVVGPGFGTGTPTQQPTRDPPRPPFDDEELETEPEDLDFGIADAIFGTGIQDGRTAFEDAFGEAGRNQ